MLRNMLRTLKTCWELDENTLGTKKPKKSLPQIVPLLSAPWALSLVTWNFYFQNYLLPFSTWAYKQGVYLKSRENDGRNIDFYRRTEHPTCLPKCTKKPLLLNRQRIESLRHHATVSKWRSSIGRCKKKWLSSLGRFSQIWLSTIYEIQIFKHPSMSFWLHGKNQI
jgi:hypothetical protein